MNIKKLIFVMRETEPLRKSEKEETDADLGKIVNQCSRATLFFLVYNAALKTTD
jgi:hypothetical protein